jgi:hypothetical protein
MGNYAMMLVLILTISVTTYSGITRKNLYQAQLDVVETYHQSNARNIAQSIAMIVVSKVEDPDDDTFDVGKDSASTYPVNGSFESWSAMSGSYLVEYQNSGDTLLTEEVTGTSAYENYLQTILFSKPDKVTGWDPDLS